MTDKSTIEQIINKAYKIANSISHFSQNETAKEILDIAIKSPEAAEYWLSAAVEAIHEEYPEYHEDAYICIQAINKLR